MGQRVLSWSTALWSHCCSSPVSTPALPSAGLSINPLTHHVTSCALNGSLINSAPPAPGAPGDLSKLAPPRRACPGTPSRLPRAWRDAVLAQRPALGLARSPGGLFTALVRWADWRGSGAAGGGGCVGVNARGQRSCLQCCKPTGGDPLRVLPAACALRVSPHAPVPT
jgi:hypothetical protein